MAKNKKSFLLYTDVHFTAQKLTNEQAGKLFKHILAYVNDENPVMNDILLEIAFEPIKQSLKRDLKKYESICLRNKENGLKGGRPKQEPKKPSGLLKNPNNPDEPKKADNDSDNDSDSDIVKDKRRKRKPFSPPSLEDVQNYFSDNGYNKEVAIKAWMSYDAANWFDSKGNPILNWKQKMINVWFTPENKVKIRMLA